MPRELFTVSHNICPYEQYTQINTYYFECLIGVLKIKTLLFEHIVFISIITDDNIILITNSSLAALFSINLQSACIVP